MQGSFEVHDVKVADINGDGFMDLVICTSDANVLWLENTDGTGLEWEEHLIASVSDGLVSAEVEDLNKDGYPDVIFAMNNSGIRWMENLDGTGLSWQEHTVQSNYKIDCDMFAIDLDLDGFTDIISGYRTSFSVNCFRNLDNTGLNWEEVEICNNFPPGYIYFGFVNGDEYPDMFIVGEAYLVTPCVSWFENPGAITPDWQEHIIKDDFGGGICLHAADLNNNGYSDLLVTSSSMVSLFMNVSGGGGWNQLQIDDGRSNFITSGNISPDGNTDVIFSKKTENELVWADLNCYTQSGYLESSVLQVTQPPNWSSVNWTADEPDSTVIGIQLRTSDNFPVMGLWTDTLYAPCSLEDLLESGDNYIQYRVILSTLNPDVTPSLQDINILWEPLEGIEEEASADRTQLALRPNPFSSILSVEFTLLDSSEVSLGIFDLSGRLITMIAEDTFTKGSFSLEWCTPAELPNGYYLVRLKTESGAFSRNCVLIR